MKTLLIKSSHGEKKLYFCKFFNCGKMHYYSLMVEDVLSNKSNID